MNIQPTYVDLTEVIKKWTQMTIWENVWTFDRNVYRWVTNIEWMGNQEIILFIEQLPPEEGKKAWSFGYLYVNGRERKIFEMDSKAWFKNEKFTPKWQSVGKYRRGTYLSEKNEAGQWENILDFTLESLKEEKDGKKVVIGYKLTIKNSQNTESTAVAAEAVSEVPAIADTDELPF